MDTMAELPCSVASEPVHAAFLAACRLDVETPKPGNVSVQSAGHGMRAIEFITSAEVAAAALLTHGAPVGLRVLDAVTRTRDAVG